jgi:hypothetical protein
MSRNISRRTASDIFSRHISDVPAWTESTSRFFVEIDDEKLSTFTIVLTVKNSEEHT